MAIISIMIRTYSHAIPGGFADGGGTVAVTSGAAVAVPSGPAAGTTTPFSPLTAKGDNASVLASKYVKSGVPREWQRSSLAFIPDHILSASTPPASNTNASAIIPIAIRRVKLSEFVILERIEIIRNSYYKLIITVWDSIPLPASLPALPLPLLSRFAVR